MKKIKDDNIKNKEPLLQRFSNSLLKNKWIVIGVFIALIIASVICSTFVQKESDVISYLDNDTVTKQGLKMLEDEFDIIGDFSMGISYLNQDQVKTILTRIENNESFEYVNKVVWVGSFNAVSQLGGVVGTAKAEQILTDLQSKFIIKKQDSEGANVNTFIINMYFKTPNSDDNTIAAINSFKEIIEEEINTLIKENKIVDADDNTKVLTHIKDVNQCYCFSGSAESSRSLLESSIGDMPKFVVAAIIAVFVILLLTTTSYLEPLIFLATLGISILLNMGTNIIAGIPIGRISSITASCATILQLAVAMDYAIFLMHTYYEELRATPRKEDAMRNALPKTIKSVVASSLTTVGGFIALFFMDFGIGYDLGFVLAKGVLLSLITVVCLQPIIILFTDKFIQKTQHKWCITPRLKFVSKVITKKGVAIPIITICVAILIPACMFQSKVDLTYITVNEENENPNMAESILMDSSNMLIVLTPFECDENGNFVYDPQYEFINNVKQIGYKKAETFSSNTEYFLLKDGKYQACTVLDAASFDANKDSLYVSDETTNKVTDIFSLFTILDKDATAFIDGNGFVRNAVYTQLHKNFISNITRINSSGSEVANVKAGETYYALYTMTIDGPKEDIASYNTLTKIRSLAAESFGTEKPTYTTGNVVAAKELSEVTPKDYRLVSIISVAIIFLILLFTFKSPLLAAILVAVIETGIWTNLSITYFMGVQLHFMAYLIVTAIALGATVDYAILVTSKYIEEKNNGATGQAAIRNAIYRAAPGVLTSGSIFFVACLAVQLLSTNIIVQQITALLSRNAIFSVILVFTFLPAILSIKERIYKLWRIKTGKGDPDEGKTNESIYSVSSKNLVAFAKANNYEIDANIIPDLVSEDNQDNKNSESQTEIVQDSPNEN